MKDNEKVEKIMINEIDIDKTLNKLRKIQILIRKESSIKKLCKQYLLIKI